MKTVLFLAFSFFYCAGALAQNGTINGTVTTSNKALALHKAQVLLIPSNRSTETGETGQFTFRNVPPGRYDVLVRSTALRDQRQSVRVEANQATTVNFDLVIAPVNESVVVTASGREESAFEALQSTTTLESLQLTQRAQTSLGEVLEQETGVGKRSFGPGSARPVLRGFDGDRVLVMLDGIPSGSLASQSGDHGENIDVLNLERLEIVRGPATLLYGSNAIGGVVNAITGYHQTHEHPHEGWSGYATGLGGTTNELGGGSAGVDYGYKEMVFRFGGGGQRSGDYETPIGTIPNSRSRNYDARGGFGWYGEKGFFDSSYQYDNRRYGIPFAAFLESGGIAGPDEEIINLRLRRQDVKVSAGARSLHGFVESLRGTAGFVHYRHGEFEGDDLGTDFFNKLFNYRLTFDQRKAGILTGTFGLSGHHRAYESVGDEALAPPIDQNVFSVFALESLNLDRFSLQFGGRFDHTGYTPATGSLGQRSFDGGSAAAGIRVPLWTNGAFVANYTHSFRAPALEELYNNGPHPGNLAFEIGDPNLGAERANGLDLSLRHQSSRFRGEVSYYHYGIQDFVFLSPTGNIEDGLFEAEYLQADSRYRGVEASAQVQLHRNLWLNAGVDAVDAELTQGLTSPTSGAVIASGTPLPRIPPVRGRIGFDLQYKGFSIRPEANMAAAQEDLFANETRTPGYTVFNLGMSYTVARQHAAHVFSINSFNLGDRLYRNHLSFIKDLAPEIGRGVRFAYTVRFF